MTSDLISREALMDEIIAALLNARFTSVRAREQHEEKIQWALDLVGEAPAVDAAPVVRCKDCKHYRDGICEQIEYIMDGYYRDTFEVKRPDDFCSYGAKMDEEE